MSIQLGPEWQEFDRRLTNTPRVMELQLRRALNQSVLLVERSARDRASGPGIKDTGRLGGSITHTIEGTYPNLQARVGPSPFYGVVVEFGRSERRTAPPVAALIPWVRRHFTPSGANEASIRGARFPGRARNRAWQRAGDRGERELRSIAFVIARKIGEFGIPARPYMRPSYEQHRLEIASIFRRVGVRIVAYLAGQPLP